MADVFISYHEKSAGEIVRKIAAELENVGVSCWYAQRDLIGPGSFAAIIARAIRDCKVFLLVMNEESNQSEHVKNEIGVAFQRISNHEKMGLALFRLDDCKLSDEVAYYLNRFQVTDGNPPEQERIQDLAKQIASILKNLPTAAMIRDLERQLKQEQTHSQKLEKELQKLQSDLRQKQEVISWKRKFSSFLTEVPVFPILSLLAFSAFAFFLAFLSWYNQMDFISILRMP